MKNWTTFSLIWITFFTFHLTKLAKVVFCDKFEEEKYGVKYASDCEGKRLLIRFVYTC